MYIVIIGGGRVGYYLTKALLAEGHEVLVIEKDAIVCSTINEELGSVCIRGDGCEATVLAEAGTDRADMLVAVTGQDEDNLVSCQVAKHKFNVTRIISRIRNPKNELLFKELGIDVTVSSTNVILENIVSQVPTHSMTHLMTVGEKGLEIVEIKIPENAGPIGKAVKYIRLPEETLLILYISPDRNPLIPTQDTVIEGGAQIIAVTPAESAELLRNTLRGTLETETEIETE